MSLFQKNGEEFNCSVVVVAAGSSERFGSDKLFALLDGEQDVWLASCGNFYSSPFGPSGSPCPTPFWGCLDCRNAVITARKLPAILAFLAFIDEQRTAMGQAEWAAKFGHAHARIARQILPAFGDDVVAQARTQIATHPPALYLPPEARA